MDPLSLRIAQIADELRAIAANGLHFGPDPYDRDRYERTMRLAVELAGFVDSHPALELERAFRGDIFVRTPLAAADAAVFDDTGRVLLVQRIDSGEWCLPGGAAEVGEPPSACAERETFEESGLRVRATQLLALYDNRAFGLEATAYHVYAAVFRCEVLGGELTTTNETSDARWCTEDEALALPLFRTHRFKVPMAFSRYREPDRPALFH